MSHKRKYNTIETIDLTGDASPIQSQRARYSETDQPQQEDWLDGNDEAGAADDIIVPSQGNNDDGVMLTYQLYGVLDTKIVGVQYYTGYASVGE